MNDTTANQESAIQMLEKREHAVLAAVPEMIGKERFMSIAMSIARSHDLKKCSSFSIVSCIYGCAKLGLVPDPALGHVYIIPRKGKATMQIGYRGLLELARRSNRVAAVHAEIVYVGEEHEIRYGTDRGIRHIPSLADDPGEPVLAYATWMDLDSRTTEFRVTTRARIERARKASETADKGFSPWKSDRDQMIRKTAIIEASKVWSLTPELAKAVTLDEQQIRGVPQTIDPLPGDDTEPEPDPDADGGLDAFAPDADPGELTEAEKAAIVEKEKQEAQR